MIRIVYVFHRKPGLSRKDCHLYWLHNHAPLVKRYSELLGIQGYSQLHTGGNWLWTNMVRLMRKTKAPYDGVGEYRIDRNKLCSSLDTPEGQEAMNILIEDEGRFIDFRRSALWIARDHIIIDGAPPMKMSPQKKLTWVGSSLAQLSPEQFQDHYLNRHAPLVKSYADTLGIYRYVQAHTIEDPLNETLRSLRGTKKPYYVHAEFIWDFKKMMMPSNQKRGRQAMQEIAEDEKRFIDFSRSAIWVSKEHVVF